MRIIAFDLESGGPSKEYSLLTAYFKVGDFLEGSFRTVDSLFLPIKHDVYRVHPGGMKVNGLDLADLEANGLTLSNAGGLLRNFLKQYRGTGQPLITPLGHGAKGDLDIIWEQLLGDKTWGAYVSRCYLDTGVLALSLKAYGLLPADLDINLESLCEYFKVGPFLWHSAAGDTDGTIAVFEALQKLLTHSGTAPIQAPHSN
jgi:hypothetical protein